MTNRLATSFLVGIALVCSAVIATQADGGTGPASAATSKLTIVAPQFGESVRASRVDVRLLVPRTRKHDVHVSLNGRDVHRLRLGRIRDGRREVRVVLSPADGLKHGENRIVVMAARPDRKLGRRLVPSNAYLLARTRFDYLGSAGLTDAPPAPYLPSTVGLNVSAGAIPWVTLTTGTPAALVDPLVGKSLPYRDTTLPLATDTPCTTTYQVLVLERSLPVNETAYSCFGDSASLAAYLATLDSTSLVIAGTTPGSAAAAGLDTTSIGGSTFANTPAGSYPQTYVVVGVPGAAAGTANESYDTTSDPALWRRSASAIGLLAVDANGNYQFLPTNAYQFEVIPNDPNTPGQSGVYIATQDPSGGGVRGYVSPANVNGFWMLLVDRVTLEPIDANANGGCDTGSCGTVYETGDADSFATATAALAAALDAVPVRQLAFVVTVGQPFPSIQDTFSGLTDLAPAFAAFGGSNYTLINLVTPSTNYVLIGAGRGSSYRSPFTPGVVNSSSLFSAQGQTGIVRGLMQLDHQSLYVPTVASQEDGRNNGAGAVSVSADYSFHQIASYRSLDWPLTDTTAHISAYHDASYLYLSSQFQTTGDHDHDLRYFYAGSPEKAASNTYFLDGTSATDTWSVCMSTQHLPSNASGYVLQDWCDVRLQLYIELGALKNSDAFLGATGIGGLVDGGGTASGDSISGEVIEAAYKALNGQYIPPTGLSVTAKVDDWVNLASALVAIPAVLAGPAGLPEIAAYLGVVSGGLKLGASLIPLDTDGTPLKYVNGFDMTLADLQNSIAAYSGRLNLAYGQALDAIYTDWGKLHAVGALTEDSSSGWSPTNQVSIVALSQQFQNGINRALYLQLLGQAYGLDTYRNAPVSDPSEIGMFQRTQGLGSVLWSCNQVYTTSPSPLGMASYPTYSGGSGIDVYVIGGTILNQGTNLVKESLPLESLLEFVLDLPDPNDSSTSGYLSLPFDLFYAADYQHGGVFPSRYGPNQGWGNCWRPGCTNYTTPAPCA